MEKAVSDNSLYFRFEDENLEDIVGNHLDDNFNARNDWFQNLTRLALTKFKFKPRPCGSLF